MALRCGDQLKQQYIVDTYAVIQQNPLRYLHLNQKKLHANLYQGLKDTIATSDNSDVTIGQRIILSSFFTRGLCHMVQNYQNAMAICKWARCLDAFVTFTCNPQWPEIKRVLLPRQ
jgi:hypothetical protein